MRANKILKSDSSYGFIISTRNRNNKGIKMIKELAYLEERAEINFETLNWYTIEEYIKEMTEQGYKTETLTEKEFEKWLKWKYPEK